MFQKLKLLMLSCLCAAPCFGLNSDTLSLEEKVGQLLMVHFQGEVANEDARVLIQDIKAGSIIYYNWSNGLTSPEQVKTLSEGLQKLAKANQTPIPLLIAADQEGGLVSRLTQGFTVFPGNKALGMTGEPTLAEEAAFLMGQELQAVGVNMNLGPVVDVNINLKNPVIGIRSFGDDSEVVATFGKKALSGYTRAGIITTLKHFPGHGDTEVDSHKALPIVSKELGELKKIELFPFAELAPFAPAIMTAHIVVPALDPDHCSTLSKKTLSYLRNEMGFQGVIISDSLIMEGVLKKCQTVDEAAVQALDAGCDILILGGRLLVGTHENFELSLDDMKRIHGSILQAVKSGRLSQERINQAVERVLKLKNRIFNPAAFNISSINAKASQVLAHKIAKCALQSTHTSQSAQSSFYGKVALFAPTLVRESIAQTSILKRKEPVATAFYGLAPTEQEIESAKQVAKTADVLIVCSCNAWKNASQASLIHSLLETGKPVIVVVARDSLDAGLFPKAHLLLETFSPTAPSFQAAWDRLEQVIAYDD